MLNSNYYCVIMAGGVGARIWPMSNSSTPKQFMDLLGEGRTLIQKTFDRFAKVCPKENIYIVTNKTYHDLTREQFPDISEEQIILEPFRRNTAPCIAYANYKIKAKNPHAVIVVAPSDHYIEKEDVFVEVLTTPFFHNLKTESDPTHNTRKQTVKLKERTDYFYYFETVLPNGEKVYINIGHFRPDHPNTTKANKYYFYTITKQCPEYKEKRNS